MALFDELYDELTKDNRNRIELFEHEHYKRIPGKKASYRQDSAHTDKSMKHSHIYAKPKGKGKELYSVNIDGSGHDGSSGVEIPQAHADYFRQNSYNIDPTNILECVTIEDLSEATYTLVFLD